MNLTQFTPYSALIGGALIGLSAVILLWISGRIAGISSIMSGLITTHGENRHWRAVFLIGLLLGTWLWLPFGDSPVLREGYPLSWIVIGGLLVGVGTRLGSGCTSGHGICGIALFSRRSISATLTFMTCGLLTVFVLRHILGVGA